MNHSSRLLMMFVCCLFCNHAAWAELPATWTAPNPFAVSPSLWAELPPDSSSVHPLDASSESSSTKVSTPPSEVPFFSWGWDIPKDLFDEYPVTKNSYWSSASCPTSGGFRFVHLRSRDDIDDYHFGGYVAVRPLAFYFNNSLVIAGVYGGFDATWNDGRYLLDANNLSDIVKTDSIPYNFGISLMWSLPRYGLQIEVEFGYSHCKMTSVDKDFNFEIPEAPGLPFTGRLTRIQEEDGLTYFFGATWLSERKFLTGVELSVSGGFRVGHPSMKTFITKIQPAMIPEPLYVQSNPTDTELCIGLLYIKALALDVTDALPSFLQTHRQFVVVEPACGMSYLGWHQGYGIVTGIRLNILESLGFSYFHSFKHNTDAKDVDVFRIEIGLEVGGRLTSLRA